MFGFFERWHPVAQFPLDAPMVGALIAPCLNERFLVNGPVRRLRLADVWSGKSAAPDDAECTVLFIVATASSPVVALGEGRLAVESGREMYVVNVETELETARFPGNGCVSPDGAMCAEVVKSVSTEHSYSSGGDWRSDWTRDGDDLSERTVLHREGIVVRFAPSHARHGETVVFRVPEAYGMAWIGTAGLVVWGNQAIDVCDLATRSHRRLFACSGVLSSVDASPSGNFVVSEPTGRPVTLLRTDCDQGPSELPELGRDGLLSVTDEGVGSSWRSETSEVSLWDARRGKKLPPFATTRPFVTWAFDAASRRAILVREAAVTLFERR